MLLRLLLAPVLLLVVLLKLERTSSVVSRRCSRLRQCQTRASTACGSFVDVRASCMRLLTECMTREMRRYS